MLDDVRIVVATDSSAILGIGDQGWGGLAIAIGKLALYTARAASARTARCPSASTSAPTGKTCSTSPAYLGVRQKRLRGASTSRFIDSSSTPCARAGRARSLQWEDLSKDTAFDVLERYRKKLPSFNDDIQGTGAVALAGLMGACALRGRKLRDEVVVVYGAGAGGAGVAWAVEQGWSARASRWTTRTPASSSSTRRACSSRGARWRTTSAPFAQPRARVADWGPGPFDLAQTIEKGKATVLLGLSGHPGRFTEPMVRACAGTRSARSSSRCRTRRRPARPTPADVLAWTGGRAIVATGSPFDPVRVGDRDVPIGQGNNAFIFPGLGFGAILAEASEITDAMVLAGADALAEYVAERHLSSGQIYPPAAEIREVSRHVATRVIEQAVSDGVARRTISGRAGVGEQVRAKMWEPRYLPFVRA